MAADTAQQHVKLARSNKKVDEFHYGHQALEDRANGLQRRRIYYNKNKNKLAEINNLCDAWYIRHVAYEELPVAVEGGKAASE